jgi:hypothetical protein
LKNSLCFSPISQVHFILSNKNSPLKNLQKKPKRRTTFSRKIEPQCKKSALNTGPHTIYPSIRLTERTTFLRSPIPECSDKQKCQSGVKPEQKKE